MNHLAPSVLSCDFSILGEQIKQVELGGADYLHLDVMDGIFVPNISFGIPVIKSVRNKTDMVFDVHLMIERPERYIKEFAKSGADIITFHMEATDNPKECIQKIRDEGKMVGVSINPETPVDVLKDVISDVDMILLMSVRPGFGGQKFMPVVLDKIGRLKDMIKDKKIDIEVDGGINKDNVESVLAAGANVIVIGSSIFGKEDISAETKMYADILKNS